MPTSTEPGITRVATDRWDDLVGLAGLLSSARAHEIVQAVYVAALRRRVELRNPEAALAYLRRAVLRRSRRLGASAVPGLATLPRRQREALVLQVYAGASDRQAAAAIGCSAAEVAAAVHDGLTLLRTGAPKLRKRLTAYAAEVAVDRPELRPATLVVRRSRRIRGLTLAVVGVLVVSAVVLGVLGVVRHHGPVSADPPLPYPGMVATTSLRVPVGLKVDSVGEAGGQVWALADDGGSDNQALVLHGPLGGSLARLASSRSIEPGASVDLAVSGSDVFVVVSDESTSVAHTTITTYDTRSAARVSARPLPDGDTAAFVRTVTGGVGGAQALVVVGPTDDGGGVLTVSLLGGGPGAQRGPLTVPPAAWSYGAMADSVSAIGVVDGVPGSAFVQGPPGFVDRVDLRSGAVGQVHLTDNTSGDGESSGVLGEVGGQLLYESSDGLFAGAPDSLTTDRIGTGDTAQDVTVIDGRPFATAGPTDDTEQAADPTTFAPVGPILTVRAGDGYPLPLPDGTVAMATGADAHGYGGTLTFFAFR